jgi:hypothetical protein
MKLTKARINKVFFQIRNTKENQNQTRKRFKNKKILTHTNTYKNKQFRQSKNTTLKSYHNLSLKD